EALRAGEISGRQLKTYGLASSEVELERVVELPNHIIAAHGGRTDDPDKWAKLRKQVIGKLWDDAVDSIEAGRYRDLTHLLDRLKRRRAAVSEAHIRAAEAAGPYVLMLRAIDGISHGNNDKTVVATFEAVSGPGGNELATGQEQPFLALR